MFTFKRPVGLLLALVLVVAACGGGDSDTATTKAPGGGDTATTGVTSPPVTNEASNSGVSTAVVVIADKRYEFDMTPGPTTRCDPDFFGAFWGIGVGTSGTSGGVELLLPPEGDPNFDEPPHVNLRDTANDLDWTADPGFVTNYAQLEGLDIQVNSFTVDGHSASGVATFVDEDAAYAFIGGTADEPSTVQGTFEITCAEE